MAYDSLADFLEELVKCGQLARIGVEVDRDLEISELTRRVARVDGPALLFEHVSGGSVAVVTNLLGTVDRVCRALSIDSLDEIFARAESLIAKHTPQNWFDRLKTSDQDTGAGKFRPRSVKNGPCQQVVRLGRDIDLAELPLARHCAGDSAPSITAGQLLWLHGQQLSIAPCPLVVLDANRVAVVDSARFGLSRTLAGCRAVKAKVPVAVVLGGDPASMIVASLGGPLGADPYLLAGLLRGQAVDVVRCRTHELEVPAGADMILEGYIDSEEPGVEVTVAGAGRSHYQVERDAPVVHLTAITHRTHPIVPTIVDCGEHGETQALAKVRERMALPAIQAVAPAVVDLRLPAYGGRDRFAFVSIRKSVPFEARQVASALWGSTSLGNIKFLVLVDAGVDVWNTEKVLAEIGARAAPDRDVFAYDGPASAAEQGGDTALVRRMAIDATTKIAGEHQNVSAVRLSADNDVVQLVTARWAEYKLDLPDPG